MKMNINKEEHKLLNEFFAREGLRETAQRELILEEFLNTEGHLSAEELYDIVKKKDRNVGQATVYRTLKILVKAGLAREVQLSDNTVRYEHLYNHEHHDHLICTGCNKVVEVVEPAIEILQKALAERHGFTLNDHRLYLYGLCDKCKTSNHQEKGGDNK